MTILKEPKYIILQKCKLSAKRIETVLTYLHSNLAKVCFLVHYIMELIGLELCELSALELENLPYLTMFIL